MGLRIESGGGRQPFPEALHDFWTFPPLSSFLKHSVRLLVNILEDQTTS